MARLLRHFIEPPRVCSYLKDREASLEIKIMLDTSPQELENMLIRGWRRFGPCYFRPACVSCQGCVSIRIPTEDFVLSSNQKRAKKNCAKLRVVMGVPKVDRKRLALYHKWHQFREGERGWDASPLNTESYAMEFAFPHPAARELLYYDDDPPGGGPPRLIGVGLCDETPNAWSAIYFFYDPDYAKLSLGTFNVVYQVELAKSKGLPHVYLGYRIEECESMQYKMKFLPHDLLIERPDEETPPPWFRAPDNEK
jgi:leucyl-tRNA---protein transferase